VGVRAPGRSTTVEADPPNKLLPAALLSETAMNRLNRKRKIAVPAQMGKG
jgi:hypothetical protein